VFKSAKCHKRTMVRLHAKVKSWRNRDNAIGANQHLFGGQALGSLVTDGMLKATTCGHLDRAKHAASHP